MSKGGENAVAVTRQLCQIAATDWPLVHIKDGQRLDDHLCPI